MRTPSPAEAGAPRVHLPSMLWGLVTAGDGFARSLASQALPLRPQLTAPSPGELASCESARLKPMTGVGPPRKFESLSVT